MILILVFILLLAFVVFLVVLFGTIVITDYPTLRLTIVDEFV